MIQRNKLISSLNKMPELLTIEEVMDCILLLNKVETGLNQSEENNTIPNEKLDDNLPQWLV